MTLDLATVRERLAALAEQWRASMPPTDPDDELEELDDDAPRRSGARGVLTVLALLLVVAGWWWWQGRPRPVVPAPPVVVPGVPVTGVAPAAPPSAAAVAPVPTEATVAAAPPSAPVPAVSSMPPAPDPVTPATATTSAAAATVTPGATSLVIVHVAGPVLRPGVVSLPAGSRVVDAVTAAGGLRSGAAVGPVNLARPVVDGERIDVGRHASAVPAVADPAAGASAPVSATTPLDLNAATQAQLEELPGVGPVLAGRILAWRTEHGRFSAVAELQEVSGIGDATFAELSPLVRV